MKPPRGAKRRESLLERKAKRILEDADGALEPLSPASMIRDQIGLTLREIGNERRWKDEQIKELLETECDVGTDLLQQENYYWGIPSDRRDERARLKKRLFDIEKERRKIKRAHQDRVDELNRQLLDLMHKHDVVSG